MGIDRLTLPDSSRRKMVSDLGLDDYKGTPENINNDAVIPVYSLGGVDGGGSLPKPLKRWVTNQAFAMAGLQAFDAFILSPSAGDNPMVPVADFCGDDSCFFALRYVRVKWGLTAAGRAAVVAQSGRVWTWIMQNPLPLNGTYPWIEWEWNVFAGASSYNARGGNMERALRDPDPDLSFDRPIFNPIPVDRLGFILTPNSKWKFQYYVDSTVWPAGSSSEVQIMIEKYRY